MASFGTIAPGTQDPEDELLRSQLAPVDDWRDREAQQALAAQQEANRPSGFWMNFDDEYPAIPSGELKGQRLSRFELFDAARKKGIGAYHMDIPDSLRRELLTKPMSLFEDTGGLGKAAAAARQTEQQAPPGTTYASWLDALEGRPNTTYASWFDALEGRPRR